MTESVLSGHSEIFPLNDLVRSFLRRKVSGILTITFPDKFVAKMFFVGKSVIFMQPNFRKLPTGQIVAINNKTAILRPVFEVQSSYEFSRLMEVEDIIQDILSWSEKVRQKSTSFAKKVTHKSLGIQDIPPTV